MSFDNGLELEIIVQGLFSHLSADSWVFEASEWSCWVENVVAIDPDCSSSKSSRKFQCFWVIFSDNSCSETVVRIVGSSYDLLCVVVFENTLNWAKNLLSCDGMMILHICKDSWLNKPTFIAVSFTSQN